MNLTCPACGTRYRVEQQDLGGPSGRTVRCANCGHTWHQAPPDGKPSEEKPQIGPAAEASAPPRGEPRLGNPPEPLWGPSFEGPLRQRAMPAPGTGRRAPTLSWVVPIVLVLLLGLAVLLGIVARGRVAAIWPSAARLYAWIGHPVEASAPGLVIGKVAPTRTADGLTIAGEIVNLGSTPREVPRLRLALQDSGGKEIQFEIVDPPKALLQPGEAAHFETPFPAPVDAATGVVVTFAPP